MALFCNLCVNQRDSLCDVPYVRLRAIPRFPPLKVRDLRLDLAEKCLISDLETASAHLFISGWALIKLLGNSTTC